MFVSIKIIIFVPTDCLSGCSCQVSHWPLEQCELIYQSHQKHGVAYCDFQVTITWTISHIPIVSLKHPIIVTNECNSVHLPIYACLTFVLPILALVAWLVYIIVQSNVKMNITFYNQCAICCFTSVLLVFSLTIETTNLLVNDEDIEFKGKAFCFQHRAKRSKEWTQICDNELDKTRSFVNLCDYVSPTNQTSNAWSFTSLVFIF